MPFQSDLISLQGRFAILIFPNFSFSAAHLQLLFFFLESFDFASIRLLDSFFGKLLDIFQFRNVNCLQTCDPFFIPIYLTYKFIYFFLVFKNIIGVFFLCLPFPNLLLQIRLLLGFFRVFNSLVEGIHLQIVVKHPFIKFLLQLINVYFLFQVALFTLLHLSARKLLSLVKYLMSRIHMQLCASHLEIRSVRLFHHKLSKQSTHTAASKIHLFA